MRGIYQMYRVGLYSEDKNTLAKLKSILVKKYPYQVYKYTLSFEFQRDIKDGMLSLDIMIWDIRHTNNFEAAAKALREKNKNIQIIFLIGKNTDITAIFDADPVYVLFAPTGEKVYAAIEKAVKELSAEESRFLMISYNRKVSYIPYQDILFIESDRRYVTIHQENTASRALMKLDEILGLLPEHFVRCHQSYVVNAHKVAGFEKMKIEMINGIDIPVSRSRYGEVAEMLGQR